MAQASEFVEDLRERSYKTKLAQQYPHTTLPLEDSKLLRRMALLTKSQLIARVRKTSGFASESYLRNFSIDRLILEQRAADQRAATYDIFLSHAFEDAIYINALRDELVEAGYSVYVDWIEDAQLDHSNVTTETAAQLRRRMNSCRSLLFATSQAAKRSIWMPWELGYMDSKTNARVAIVPIAEDADTVEEFKGQEYLGLYPYFDKTGTSLYIHKSAKLWVGFKRWLEGADPISHT